MSTKDVSSKENSDIPTLGKTPPMLSYFCVYNPSLSQSEENTKDQILYYTAKKVVPADVKMKQVGLAQALVSVASTFSTTEVTQNVHSQKNRMVFLQPEPGFWMHMCIELGILRRQIKDQKGKEKLVTEYLDTELNDQALSAVLEIGYEQFKLLNGTMSSLLYGEDSLHQTPNRHRTRTLMLAIEEFFSTWIWLWDFDKLDTMVFGAVFNGVPSQPVLRSNYLNIYDLDNAIQKHFDQHINHLLVLDDDGSLIYRSPSLDLIDVRALRKYIIKRVESHIINAEEMEKKQKEKDIIAKKEKGSTTLKSLTKSFSQVHILNYFTNKSFTSAPATPVSASLNEALDNVANNDVPINDNTPSTDISEPQSADGQEINHRGKFLTGMIEVNIEDLNGEERIVTRPDIVHVYINSQPNIENHEDSDDNESENGYIGLTEYILIIYKDNNDLTWSFLLPSFIQEVDDLVKDIDFYTSLEKFMMEQKLDDITESVLENIKDIQERR
ncbi:hypothetical protein BJ944DRAFT_254218 [Cunninghamella echinulata]|nr:hypothetical protein BJ944DRAFT_254218 [Cunninghamella echinulata]